jgi:hypothetical protein
MKVKINNFKIDYNFIKELYSDFPQNLVGKTIDVEVDGSEDEDDLVSIVINEITREITDTASETTDTSEWIWYGIGELDYEVVEKNN